MKNNKKNLTYGDSPRQAEESSDHLPRCFGIIPTRYASSRFEGKPLAKILGKPLFWHVYTRVSQCSCLEKVVLATDDSRIYDAAQAYDIPVLMTGSAHTCGSERVHEAAQILGAVDDEVVINIQGDEPLLEPKMLYQLLEPFSQDDVEVATLARKINYEEAQDPDQVKVVLAKDGKALYFSRSLIPYPRDGRKEEFWGHIGIYAFRMRILEKFVALGSEHLERKEKLEQLRLLENGVPIHVVKTDFKCIGVDRPEDIAKVEKMLSAQRP